MKVFDEMCLTPVEELTASTCSTSEIACTRMPLMPIASVSNHINGDAQRWCARSPLGCYIDTRRRSAFGRTNDDPNMLTEYRERLHQALKRDATELIVSDRRDLRLRHA